MQKSFCKTNLYIQYTRVLTIRVNSSGLVLHITGAENCKTDMTHTSTS
jgi:hypothetical protein